MNRRGFLRALGIGAAASPIAGKQLAEEAAAKLAGVKTSGLNGGEPSYGATSDVSHEQYRMGFAIPTIRRQVEDLVRQEHKHVYSLDPDLAVLKSVSLNAKIAYQRQRNVARRMEEMQNEYPWDRMRKLVSGNILGKLLGG